MKSLLAGRPKDESPQAHPDDWKELVSAEERDEWDVDKAAKEAVDRAFLRRKEREKGKDESCDDA